MSNKISANIFIITGGSGFIGTNLINYIHNKYDNAIALDIKFSFYRKYSSKLYDYLYTDIRSKESIIYSFSKLKHFKEIKGNNKIFLIHLAALTDARQSMVQAQEFVDTNINGTKNVLEIAREMDINFEKIIFASSAATMVEPLSIYGMTKLVGEHIVKQYGGHSYRFQNVIGEYMHDGIGIKKFINNIKEDKEIQIYGSLDNSRNYIYVQELCKYIYESCLGINDNIDISERVYELEPALLTTNKTLSHKQLLEYIQEYSGKQVKYNCIPMPAGDTAHSPNKYNNNIWFETEPKEIVKNILKHYEV